MKTFDENDVVRDTAGRFGEKPQSAPEVGLSTEEHNPRGRLVYAAGGIAVTAENMEDLPAGAELTFEEYIDTREEFELDSVYELEEQLADMGVSYVSASTDPDNPDIVNVDVNVYENFLWDVDSNDEAATDERRTLLDENRHILEQTFQDAFNAEIGDIPEDWDSVPVSIRVPVQRQDFTPTLAGAQAYSALAKYQNETDPGTYASGYVMNESWARVARGSSEAAPATHGAREDVAASREYWVGTQDDPELYGPYTSEQAGRTVIHERQGDYDEPLQVTNSDDAY